MRVEGKLLLKDDAHNVLRAYDTHHRRSEDDRAVDVMGKLYRMSEVLSCGQKDAISLFYFGGRELTEKMLADGARKIAGVADVDVELDLGQLECDITPKLKTFARCEDV